MMGGELCMSKVFTGRFLGSQTPLCFRVLELPSSKLRATLPLHSSCFALPWYSPKQPEQTGRRFIQDSFSRWHQSSTFLGLVFCHYFSPIPILLKPFSTGLLWRVPRCSAWRGWSQHFISFDPTLQVVPLLTELSTLIFWFSGHAKK